MTKPDLAAIKARADAATPGPWQFYELPGDDGIGYLRPDPEDGLEISHHGDEKRSAAENRANAAFVIHARRDIPALIARVEELEVENESLRDNAIVGIEMVYFGSSAQEPRKDR